MRLASLRAGGPDGTLIAVDRSGTRGRRLDGMPATLQRALESWERTAPLLEAACRSLDAGQARGFVLDPAELAAPLPRSYQWLDGSAYLSHVERVRQARGADMPERLWRDPLMYQGAADRIYGPRDPFPLGDPAWGLDFEAEIGVITAAVPMGVAAADAAQYIRLVVLINDWSLRHLIPDELAKGFGFVHGKPHCALAAFAVSPDELGGAWDGSVLHGEVVSAVNGEPIGRPDAGQDMQFDFARLISHAACTRDLGAGSLIGSGTVSNRAADRGCACLVERRLLEQAGHGQVSTPYLGYGDRVRIDVFDGAGRSLFGAIDQRVIPVAG